MNTLVEAGQPVNPNYKATHGATESFHTHKPARVLVYSEIHPTTTFACT